MMLPMTSLSASAPVRRLILIPAEQHPGRSAAAVRRFRLAKLRLEDRDIPRAERFEHCRRSYD